MNYIQQLALKNDVTWLESTFLSKRSDTIKIKREEAILLGLYAVYEDIIINFNTQPIASIYPSGNPDDKNRDKLLWSGKKMLLDHYENPPNKLKENLVFRRREHGLSACPYCGNPVMPSTLDHFMPKDKWPEYAIYPDNLVPQCLDCAPIKGQSYYSHPKGSCEFVHPIYSDLLSRIGFNIHSIINNGEFTFRVTYKYDSSLTKNELERLKNHLISLNVNNRINDFCKRNIKKIINEQKTKNNDIRYFLNVKLSRYYNRLNLYSNWKDAFYSSLLNDDIIEYLNSLYKIENQESSEGVISLADLELEV
ncbi:HNH endonuclease [Yersinia enterocolitica]|uniref:HNH endonuclease n=1 Tax=Yersinia enterocolitica TaxID=630 RepID=UPI001C60CEEF|nr:hypothetical protein [Yersinia enterocolitica]MBW5837285.1 hypothetical protein [Yersinia enterocolitica]MBW5855339.1 hypothetical protein [Yersinia enterocolitica]MBW5861146.1 hypothetical protein [Yersinia enterocolitica]MBW5872053.1 hypothetical protein [Yersinia enterocolitica]HEI6940478.1 hypothetical protein [Yersinia enterocolitica]